MQREVYLVSNALRLMELCLPERDYGNHETASLGLGFYCLRSAKAKGVGAEVDVAPAFLSARVMDMMAEGHLAPSSKETVFFGLESAPTLGVRGSRLGGEIPVSRWLLKGLLATDGNAAPKPSSLHEAMHALLQGFFDKALQLRAGTLVLLVDEGILGRYFGGLGSRDEWMLEFVRYVAEEVLHPRVALVSSSPAGFESLAMQARRSVLDGGGGGAAFRF